MYNISIKDRIFTISQITNYIKNIINNDIMLSNLMVKGEISNLKKHESGHIYFTLKDNLSKIRAVMFKGNAQNLKFELENGLSVIIKGYCSVYERDGQYQLYVENITVDGVGALYKSYEQLKAKLQYEGLFENDRKKLIPYMPLKVGIITSPTGAVIKDIIAIIRRRCPFVDIINYPAQVQGANAPFEISNGIKFFNTNGKTVDVIIIARGGGSIEELWTFNEEVVARAIVESEIPIISSIGHETDYTIADFVADLRAATPSEAAEMCVPDINDLKVQLSYLTNQLNFSINRYIKEQESKVLIASRDKAFNEIEKKLHNFIQTVDMLNQYLNTNIIDVINKNKEKCAALMGKLNLLNPASVLYRGYSITTNSFKNNLINSIDDVKLNDFINVRIKNGVITAQVIKKCKGE